MKQLFYYGLQVVIASGILYGYYHFFLRNKRFHQYNRFYLMLATLLSLAVPFLNIPVYFNSSDTNSSLVLETLTVLSSAGTRNAAPGIFTKVQTGQLLTWESAFRLLYISISALLSLRIVISLLKIRQIIRDNTTERIGHIHLVKSSEPGTPFSFFRWLFWNNDIELKSEKGEQVFRHEFFHIEQKHSLDTLFMEMATALCWFNPFFHLAKKEIKAIHEFLADQFAVTESTKWQYAEFLLMRAMNTRQSLVNSFFHNQIKRRIAMITYSSKPGHQYMRKLMVLPVATTVFILFSFNYKTKTTGDTAVKKPNMITADFVNNSPAEPANAPLMPASDTSKPGTVEKIYEKVDIESTFPGGINEWSNFLRKNINEAVPVNSGAPAENYTVIVQFIVNKNGYLSDIRPLTKHGYGMEQEVVRLIRSSPRWIPAVRDGKKVAAYRKQPVTFCVTKDPKKDFAVTDNKIFEKTEIEPAFPGGEEKWKKYLTVTLDRGIPIKNNAPKGNYSVVVQFIVNLDGSIRDVKPLTKHGYGMEDEALRVIKKGPKWLPAIQNGIQVVAYKKVLIHFFMMQETQIVNKTPSFSASEIKDASLYELLHSMKKP